MRFLPLLSAAALLAAGITLGVGSPATADTGLSPADLPRLRAELMTATAQAEALADRLDQAAAQDGGLRAAMAALEEARDQAKGRLAARAREVYMRTGPDPLRSYAALAAPGLREYARRGAAAQIRVEQDLINAVARESRSATVLRARAARHRAALQAQARDVLATQERARSLLATAEALAARAQLLAEQQRLAAARHVLDSVSATVTRALTPAQTARSRRAQIAEAPVVGLVESAAGGYPAGYRPTGHIIRGIASWYGPGFVGSPTASGAPYDPERLTCANKELPLGTVVRVSRAGLAISCLVNDRGPYVGARVIDLSRAGSRALGFDGTAEVAIEVLTPR
ncbi:MAG TPA: septal ring lytic transglycosylase RlpA family protein [Mycobacteriales bacterium]|nr:septal ring lytic transglycosylase RlpA family protein [Mycobacteriales bacterium]